MFFMGLNVTITYVTLNLTHLSLMQLGFATQTHLKKIHNFFFFTLCPKDLIVVLLS